MSWDYEHNRKVVDEMFVWVKKIWIALGFTALFLILQWTVSPLFLIPWLISAIVWIIFARKWWQAKKQYRN